MLHENANKIPRNLNRAIRPPTYNVPTGSDGKENQSILLIYPPDGSAPQPVQNACPRYEDKTWLHPPVDPRCRDQFPTTGVPIRNAN